MLASLVPISLHDMCFPRTRRIYFKILNSFISQIFICFVCWWLFSHSFLCFLFSIHFNFIEILPPVYSFDVIHLAMFVWAWARVHCDLKMWIIYNFIAFTDFVLCVVRIVWQINTFGPWFMQCLIIIHRRKMDVYFCVSESEWGSATQ